MTTMRYKLLGRSGLRVSELCLGTMSFGDKWGFGADEKESRKIVDAYAEAGGNFLDTANKYHEGQSEQIVGAAVGKERDRWVIATKYTLAMREGDPNAAGNSRKNMMQSVEGSLKRLGTDYIDLLWVHAWDFTTPEQEVLRGLDDLVRMGKVGYVGISDAPAWVVSRANTMAELRGWTSFVAMQVEHSLIERTVERDILPMTEALGLTVTAWAPIGGGVLTGKYTRGEPTDSKRAKMNEARLSEQNLAIAREVDLVADELGHTSAQVATAWVRQRSGHLLPILGVRKVSQMQDLIGSVDVTLSPEHMRRLDEVSRIDLGFPHQFLRSERIRGLVYGDREPQIELPSLARPEG